ncbi:14345_t:CDS:2, partial [Racocetra persica]
VKVIFHGTEQLESKSVEWLRLDAIINKEVETKDHNGGINDFGIEEFDSRRCFV